MKTKAKTPTSQVRELKKQLKEIAALLSCRANIIEILPAIIEANNWKGSYMAAMTENDGLRVKMGESIKTKVDELTFNLQLENQKLKVEVERLTKILDTKDNETVVLKEKTKQNQKGFWDFVYKICKVV